MRASTTERLAPQANRLSVVATVVDAVAAGCDTADAIADAIGMSGRQGSYYPNAAHSLGYIEPVPHTSPVQWTLTERGVAFADMGAAQRCTDLVDALADLEEMSTFTRDAAGADHLAEEWAGAGYSAETISRRLHTMESWATFLGSEVTDQETALDSAAAFTRERAPQARERARAAAAQKAAAAAKAEPLQGQVCGSCFIMMPLTGSCPNCE